MAKKGKTDRRIVYNVSPAKFVEVWQTSASLAEVSKRLKMPEPIVLARKSNYIRAGIKLKRMPKKRRTGILDTSMLNGLIKELDDSGKNPTLDNNEAEVESPETESALEATEKTLEVLHSRKQRKGA